MMNYINVIVTSNAQLFQSERRFSANINMAEFLGKLELLTGVPSHIMQLELIDCDGNLLRKLNTDDLEHTLQQLGVCEGMVVHVIDPSQGLTKNGRDAECSDIASKFELSDMDYDKRNDSVRAWKQRQELGRFDPKREEKERQIIDEAKKVASNIEIGHRCEVRIDGSLDRRGTIAFVGDVHFKPGIWIGVIYDEPVGKNDGSVDGKRYFNCAMKYGGFVRPQNVVTGNFPEKIFDDIDEI